MKRSKKNEMMKNIIRVIAIATVTLMVACILVMFTGCAAKKNDTPENSTASKTKSEYAILRLPDDTLVMIEFMYPSIPGAKYTPTDNGACEIAGFSINEIRNFDK